MSLPKYNIAVPISQTAFNILLALSLRPRHGYEIMKQVHQDTNGYISLGPGALYGTIKILNDNNFIEVVPSEKVNDRRKYYRLTKKGWDQLEKELEFIQNSIVIAKQRRAIGSIFNNPVI